MNEQDSYIYILASGKNGTLFIGVTDDLLKSVSLHKDKNFDGFAKKHSGCDLVHFESFNDVNEAIKREKQLQQWGRAWKVALIVKGNQRWKDLYPLLVNHDAKQRRLNPTS